MGHRSNSVLIDSGSISIRYSQWGAHGLPEILLRGPEDAIASFRADRVDDRLMSDVWCEGAALLDLDHRYLLFFGGFETRYLHVYQRALLRLLAPEWPSWTIVWAGQGILDIAEYIGAAPDSGSEKTPPEAPSLETLARTSAGTISTPYTVLTLVDRNGSRDIGVGHDPFSTLLLGPGLLSHLSDLKSTTLPREDNLGGGILVDPERRTVRLWCGPPTRRPLERIREIWTGWEVSVDLQGLAQQLELTGRDPMAVRISDAAAEQKIRELYMRPPRSQWPR
jgi:hypothetical protein